MQNGVGETFIFGKFFGQFVNILLDLIGIFPFHATIALVEFFQNIAQLDNSRCEEFNNLESLVHSYKIKNRTLAEIICDENNIPRSVLPVKRKIEKWQINLFDGASNEK